MRTRTEVIQELQETVETDRHRWKVTAFPRAITTALNAHNKRRPLTATANLHLQAGKGIYAADECMVRYLGSYWGMDGNAIPTWCDDYPGALPRVITIHTVSGLALQFLPAPTHKLISLYGRNYEYLYTVGHVLTDDDCSIRADDYDLFFVRCLAALMQDLIASNVTDPIQMHKGLGSIPNLSTPIAARDALMAYYNDGMAL